MNSPAPARWRRVNDPLRIVLSRLDRLGDLILSTPAIRTLRRSFPAAHITLVCSPRNCVAVAHNSDIDECIVVADRAAAYAAARKVQGADIAVALAPRTADYFFVAATRARRRIGYTYVRRHGARLLGRLLLTDPLVSQADPALCEAHPERPVQHEVKQLLDLVRTAGAQNEQLDLVVNLQPADHAAVAHIPAGGINVHLAPRWFGTGSTAESLHMLLRELRGFGRPVIVSYAPECADGAAAIAAEKLADAVVGDLAFGEWAALLARAACVITVDTSATHVASATGRPTAVLFEHAYFALNSREWAPWRVPGRAVRKPAVVTDESLAACRQELLEAVGSLLNA